MSEPVSHELKHPLNLTFNKGKQDERVEAVTSVTITRPKAKDLRLADAAGGDVDRSIRLISRLTGLEVFQVDELDAEDFALISDIIEGFTPPGRRTGETPSEI